MEWGRPPYPLTRGCELRKHPVPGTIAIAIAIEDYARDRIEEAHRSHETRCASNPGCFNGVAEAVVGGAKIAGAPMRKPMFT
jgi:hypothetical protein